MIELVKGLALLLSLCLLYSFVLRLTRRSDLMCKLSMGVLFGAIAIIAIISPLQVHQGLIFDVRSVVLSLGGLFGGPIVAVISSTMAAAFRLWVGGPGAIIGFWLIFVSSGLGVAYYICVRRGILGLGIPQFLIFGAIIQAIVALSLIFLIPGSGSAHLDPTVASLLVVRTIATAILGRLLLEIEDFFKTGDRLHETSRQLATVLESMPDGISVLDQNLRAVAFNSRYLDLMGFPHDQFQQGDPLEKFVRFNITRGEYGDVDVENFVATEMARVKRFEANSLTVTRPNGTVVAMNSNPLPDGGMVTLYSDITVQRKERRDLEIAKTAAENASASKSQFLSHMSHELRTPLNSIIGFSELIISQIYGEMKHPRYQEYVHDIKRSGEHLLRLINDILDLSKIDAGYGELYETSIHLKTLLDQCIRMVDMQDGSSKVRITLQAEDRPFLLWADDRLIKQIVLNLLSNAVKYNVKGGRIKISTGCGPDGGIFVTVADTGIGIAQSDLKKVMEPFGQARSDAYRAHEGTGLGLSLSKQFTELHGGTLVLTSEEGVGTIVTISFPPERTMQDHTEGEDAASEGPPAS
jgi:two-component system cell cycle sensor histidine kinase PleC